jgi:simple sugar transport system substrate-binding protein
MKSAYLMGKLDDPRGCGRELQFCIDQQPFLQGYLAVTQLYLYKKNGNIMCGGGPVLTGPSFVDSSNTKAILPFVQKNTR